MDTRCHEAISQALTYIGKKTNHWTTEHHAMLRHDAQFAELETAVYAAAETGDVHATKAACRAWWTYILAYVPVEVAA